MHSRGILRRHVNMATVVKLVLPEDKGFMRTVLTVSIGTMLLAAATMAADQPAAKEKASHTMSNDMRRAIAFQRAKDRADARQARIEAKHPAVTYNNADRGAGDNRPEGRNVPDPGPKK